MPRFTTRVQLVKVVPENYDILHEEMEKVKFTRNIKFGKIRYHLPDAEYNFDSKKIFQAKLVLDLAKQAAKKAVVLMSEKKLTEEQANKSFRILVTKADGNRKIYNLKVLRS
jgi:hypothetical protein